MKLAQYKYFAKDGRFAWLRLLQFGEGQDERAVLDVCADYNPDDEKFGFSHTCFLAQIGGDALLQFHITLWKFSASIAIWSV